MPTRRLITTLLQRLQKQPHSLPYTAELEQRLDQFIREASRDRRSRSAYAFNTAEALAVRVLRRLCSFDARKSRSAQWLRQVISELEAESRVLSRAAEIWNDVAEHLRQTEIESAKDPALNLSERERKALEQLAIKTVANSGQFEDTTWNAYLQFVHEGKTGDEVAGMLKIATRTVYQYVRRVRKAVEVEFNRLLAERGPRGRAKASN